jgi:hypothetical protein
MLVYSLADIACFAADLGASHDPVLMTAVDYLVEKGPAAVGGFFPLSADGAGTRFPSGAASGPIAEPRTAPRAEGHVEGQTRERGVVRAKSNKRWLVMKVYHDRLQRNESVAVRAIAEAVGCSPGYVSKILKRIPSNRGDGAPQGSKSRDGALEAWA